MSAAGPQDAVVLDLIGRGLHRLQRARHDPARRPAARGVRQAAARRRARTARCGGCWRSPAPRRASRCTRTRDGVRFAGRLERQRVEVGQDLVGERERVAGGREVRVGDRDHAQPGGVGGADAVLGVLDRGAVAGSTPSRRVGLEVDVGRGLAARDLLGGDRGREAVGRRPCASSTRSITSRLEEDASPSGMRVGAAARPPRGRPAAAAGARGSRASIASHDGVVDLARGVSSTCRAARRRRPATPSSSCRACRAWRCRFHVPPCAATTSWRASSHTCSESTRTPSRSKMTAAIMPPTDAGRCRGAASASSTRADRRRGLGAGAAGDEHVALAAGRRRAG